MSPFVISQIFDDPTSEGVINLRIVRTLYEISGFTTLTKEERERFLRLLLLVGKKLVATWRHLDRFQNIQDDLVTRFQNRPPIDPGRPIEIDTGQDLFIEFDEFLVQIKSSLDYLVKVPTAILGKGVWSLETFGEKGQKVLRALDRNLPRKFQVHAKGIKELILDKHLPWLEWAISLRDSLNHLIQDDFAFESFAVGWREEAGVWRIHVPRVEQGITATQAMTDLWNQLLMLVEDFTAAFLVMRIKPGFTLFHGVATPGGPESPWIVTTQEAMDQAVARDKELLALAQQGLAEWSDALDAEDRS